MKQGNDQARRLNECKCNLKHGFKFNPCEHAGKCLSCFISGEEKLAKCPRCQEPIKEIVTDGSETNESLEFKYSGILFSLCRASPADQKLATTSFIATCLNLDPRTIKIVVHGKQYGPDEVLQALDSAQMSKKVALLVATRRDEAERVLDQDRRMKWEAFQERARMVLSYVVNFFHTIWLFFTSIFTGPRTRVNPDAD